MPFEIPESWEWTTLGEISNYGQCENVNADKISEEDWILELEDIEKDSGHILQKLHKRERKICGTRHKFYLDNILYSKLRTYLNKVLVAPASGFCTTEIIPIRSFIIVPQYLCLVLRSNYYLDYTTSLGYGVKMPRLGTNDAISSYIPIPPLFEQTRIVNEIDKWNKIIDDIEIQTNGLSTSIEKAKSKILDLAISGKLVPQDPNDEPAIELLKRINPNFVPCDNSHYEKLPEGWIKSEFKDIFKTISVRDCQIQQREIADKGEYPVISQSSNYIEGYSNRKDKVLEINKPVIVFGDHTRIVKYIDFPFIIGADGVKVIETNVDAKYAYYLLLRTSTMIENKGYSRHFQFLSKHLYIIPPLAEQKRIVNALTDIYNLLDEISSQLA